eukprot:scaffold426_cov319-Pavlova_lutheri.AAC.26
MDWNGVGRANWGGQDRVRNIQDQKGPVLVHVGLPGGTKVGNSEGKSIGMVHEVLQLVGKQHVSTKGAPASRLESIQESRTHVVQIRNSRIGFCRANTSMVRRVSLYRCAETSHQEGLVDKHRWDIHLAAIKGWMECWQSLLFRSRHLINQRGLVGNKRKDALPLSMQSHEAGRKERQCSILEPSESRP